MSSISPSVRVAARIYPLVLLVSLWTPRPTPLSAQTREQADGGTHTFEVASIRRDVEPRLPISKVSALPGGRFQATTSLRDLIAYAYALQPYQRIEGDANVLNERFIIVAKAPADIVWSREEQLRMVRQLLADRFRLRVRFEDEWQRVSILRRAAVETFGPHLRPLTEACAAVEVPVQTDSTAPIQQPRCHVTFINGHLTALVERMSDFSMRLSSMARRAVVDETGLRGPFELEMTFNPATFFDGLRAPVGMEEFPAFADALRRELGLTVETERRAVPALIIEHVEQPTAN